MPRPALIALAAGLPEQPPVRYEDATDGQRGGRRNWMMTAPPAATMPIRLSAEYFVSGIWNYLQRSDI